MSNIYLNEELTWGGVVKRMNKGENQILGITEVLDKDMDWVNTLAVKPGNGTQAHDILRRLKRASIYSKRMGEGVPASSSEVLPASEPYGTWASYTKIEEDTYNRSPEPQKLMLQETTDKIKGHKEAYGLGIIYGDGTPGNPLGFANRIKSASDSQFINGSGATDGAETSIYVFSNDPEYVYTAFPLNTKAGLDFQDLGTRLITESVTKDFGDGQGSRTAEVLNTYRVSKFSMSAGLVVADAHQIVRIGNIKVADLTADASAGVDIFNKLVLAKSKVHYVKNLNALVSPTIYAYMELQAYNKSNAMVQLREVEGGYKFLEYAGIAIHRSTQVSETENVVS